LNNDIISSKKVEVIKLILDDIYSKKIFTIGYSAFTINEFVNILQKNNINFVADVRSIPYSATYPDYNKNLLETYLKHYNISYQNFKNEFGARQIDEEFFTDDYLDFTKFINSEQFLTGVEEIKNLIYSGYKIVLMCAEGNPENCHRCIMIAKYFYDTGYEVKHFLPDGSIINQENVDYVLVNKFFSPQLSLFERNDSEENMTNMAYRLQNKEIGFRLNREEDIFH